MDVEKHDYPVTSIHTLFRIPNKQLLVHLKNDKIFVVQFYN